jgi:hypothetical protein
MIEQPGQPVDDPNAADLELRRKAREEGQRRQTLNRIAPKLLEACKRALAAYDQAHTTGKSTWGGADVDFMRAAVAEAERG